MDRRIEGMSRLGYLILLVLTLVYGPHLEISAVEFGESFGQSKKKLYPGIPRCDIYEVNLISALGIRKLAVFQSAAPEYISGKQGLLEKDRIPLKIHAGRSISWTSFDLEGSIIVEVKVNNPQKVALSENVRIIPSRAQITVKVQGDTLRFTLDKPGQFSVEIGSEGYRNGLMIFADPPETEVPDQGSEKYVFYDSATPLEVKQIPLRFKGIYFKSGTHNIGRYRVPEHIKHIYLAKGAWVDGALILDGNKGVRIFGRGVLSSRRLDYRSAHGIEAIRGSHQTHIEGIVVADFKHFAIKLISTRNTIKWVKVIGAWVWNMDGIAARDGSKILNSFIWANDDAIKAYRHNLLFSDIVVWQLDNGGIIQMSWGNTKASHVIIRRLDILHAEWSHPGFNRSLLNCVGNRYHKKNVSTVIENWLIEDVVTETPVPAIFRIAPYSHTPVQIKNLILRNWKVKMTMGTKFKNLIKGTDSETPFSGFRFENVIFNGTKLTGENWRETIQVETLNLKEPVFK